MSGNSSTSRWGTGVALLLAGLLVVSSVGPAVAAPRVFVSSASIDTNEAVTGEPITLSIRLGNTGDSDGATSVDISANGEVIKSNQYAVEAGERRTVTTNLSFAEPGEYSITVNGNSAGTVAVNRTVVETTDRRTDGRTMLVRAGQIGTNERVSTSFPVTNDSLAVTSLTARTSQSGFERNVSTYTDASSAPMELPSGDGTTVFGAVTVEQLSGVNDRRVRIGVNQSVVDAANVSSDEISIYSGDDEDFDRTETTFEGTVDGRYVYEARTNDTETLFLGSLAPVFEVSDHDLSTSESGIEKEIVVSATARNVGDVSGNYTASMLIDGEVVTTETVTLEPGESQAVTTSHAITRDGNYRVALDDQFVGSVVVSTGDAEQTETATDGSADEPTESGTTEPSDGATDQPSESDTETDAGDGDGGGFDVSIPEPDVGLTEIAIGGGVAVIGVLLVLLQRW
jgi:hypothetical protein